MRLLVVDVAAERSGALSVLRSMHAAAQRHHSHDWIFITSSPELDEYEHVSVRRFPWVKKSWFHRLWFDLVVTHRIIRDERPDVVVSLQNLPVLRFRQRQVVYLHTALPFSKYRFNLRNEPKLWLYQKVITRLILSAAKTVDRVVVQAPWIKAALVEAAGVNSGRVSVIRPIVAAPDVGERYVPTSENRRRFVYPAAALPYKNHALLFEAAALLEREGTDVEIICTISDKDLGRLGIDRVPANVRLVGRMPFDEVQRAYSRCVLLFPSILETVGLPLMEAQARQTFILASALSYSRDVLDGYENAYYFDPTDSADLALLMTTVIDGSVRHSPTPAARSEPAIDPWDEFVQVVVAP